MAPNLTAVIFLAIFYSLGDKFQFTDKLSIAFLYTQILP